MIYNLTPNKITELTKRLPNGLTNVTDSSGMIARIYKGAVKTTVKFYFKRERSRKATVIKIGDYPHLTIDMARQRYYDMLSKFELGIIVASNNGKDRTDNVRKLSDAWHKWREASEPNQQYKTIKKYDSLYKSHIKQIEDTPLEVITPQYVMDHILKSYLDNKEYATADRIASALNACMKTAVFYEWVKANPLTDIKSFIPKAEIKHYSTFTPETRERRIKELMDALHGESDLIRAMVVFYFHSLLRSLEVREIKIENIYDTYIKVKTKTLKEFKVPLTDELKKIIAKFKGNRAEGLLFTYNGHMVSENAVNTAFKRLGFNDLTVHGIRTIGQEWLRTQDDIKESIAKLCISHVAGDRTDRAYMRDMFLSERTIAMSKFSNYLHTLNVTY